MEQDLFATLTYDRDPDQDNDLRGAKIELLLSGSDLADLDTFSKSDPMCVVFVKKFGQWKELGRTEAEDETLSPRFTESFILDYDYDLHQHLLFSVYDVDSKSTDLRKHDFVGSVETSLSHLLKNGIPLSSTSLGLWAPGDDKCRGHLHVTCEVLKPCRGKVSLHLGAGRLDKRGMFATTKASTILEVGRSINAVDFHPVYRSEVAHKTQSPRWRPFELSLQKLCNGDPYRQVEFSVWYIKDSKEKKKIGSVISTIHDLTKKQNNGGRSQPYHMTSHRTGRKSVKSSGELRFINYSLDMSYTLIDYVRGGCDLRLIVAIDFTSSNGPIEDPHSLHYLGHPQSPKHHKSSSSLNSSRKSGWYPENQYVEAVKLMGSLLGQYDTEDTILAFGFGAKTKGSKKVNDCFALNVRSGKPEVKGIKGLLDAYRKCAGKVTFSGPSRLAPVIEQAANIARQTPPTQDRQHYNVLLIITDGVVNDLDSALSAASQASNLPLSLAIVGVGPADFSSMDLFQSGSNQEKPSLGSKSRRSNTCFAALRKHNYVTGANMAISRDVMARVSKQLVTYMKTSSITPNKPREQSRFAASRDKWVVDTKDLSGEQDHMDLAKLTFDPISPKMTLTCDPSGPMCPTCGAEIQPGHDEVFEISL